MTWSHAVTKEFIRSSIQGTRVAPQQIHGGKSSHLPTIQRDAGRPHHSRLGKSLVRIQQRLENCRERHDQVQNLYLGWQEQWKSQRQVLTKQLEQIETMLGKLTGGEQPQAQFSIVGIHHDGE